MRILGYACEGTYHIHKPDRVHFQSGTLGSSVQARFTCGGCMYFLVIKEIVETVTEALALLGLTWNRNKSLRLSRVSFLFWRDEMLPQSP